MARKRIDLGPGADERIIALMAKGTTFQTIAKELGVSPATAKRRMAELRGSLASARLEKRAKAPKPKPVRAPLPDDADAIPEGTPLEQIGQWLRLAQEEVDAARGAGESEMVAKMVRLAAALLTLQQKATPIPPPDPNENPDFIVAAAQVRERMHRLVSNIVKMVEPK